jgi:hypothetical protein
LPFKVRLVHGADIYSLHRPGADDIRLHVSELKRAPPALREDAATAAADPDPTPNAASPEGGPDRGGPSPAPGDDLPVSDDDGDLADGPVRENPGPDPGGVRANEGGLRRSRHHRSR